MPTAVTINRLQLGEIPGPVSLVCDEGETVYALFFTEDDTGIQHTLQLCVPNNLAPCDSGGLWSLFSAAGWSPTDDPCP